MTSSLSFCVKILVVTIIHLCEKSIRDLINTEEVEKISQGLRYTHKAERER